MKTLHTHVCECCEVTFQDEADYYDLCPECCAVYEKAFADGVGQTEARYRTFEAAENRKED